MTPTTPTFPKPLLPGDPFKNGVYGLIQMYGLQADDILYLNARPPHGYEVIFRTPK